MRSVWSSLAKRGSQEPIVPLSDKSLFEILPQNLFLRTLALERKRTDRSQRCFVLMLLKSNTLFDGRPPTQTIERVVATLSNITRQTDIIGWYEAYSTIGVLFTEVGDQPKEFIIESLSKKIRPALREAMGRQSEDATLSFYVYPEDLEPSDPNSSVDSALYLDLDHEAAANKTNLRLKRTLDIVGSLFGIFLSAPLLVAVAILVKLSSRGPVLFRQQRIGRYGRPFTFLKFRSMCVNNDPTVHREYVMKLIASCSAASGSKKEPVYKLTRDPRITNIGKFLRRTSLDELPQLFNVLKGDMSLVGPRPPIAYELAAYAGWHRNRLMVVKPGITGLWQVAGRSRVTFDEMVRLDLRYAASWSIWLDLAILLQTPRAVITGQGAY